MYREAMEYLMAAPPTSDSTTSRRKEDSSPTPTSATAACGGEGVHAKHVKPDGGLSDANPADAGDAGQNGKKVGNTTVRNDEAMTTNV